MKSIARLFAALQHTQRWRFVTIAVALLIASPGTARAQRALGVDVSQFQGD